MYDVSDYADYYRAGSLKIIKKAELIILELKNKMDVIGDGSDLVVSEEDNEAIDALVGLGYKKHEAKLALESVGDDVKDSGEKIKAALKNMGKK